MNLPSHITELSPSENAARQILRLARQIARRDDLAEDEVLGSRELLEICQREKLGRKDKLRSVRTLLEEIRYPLKAQIEQEVGDCVSAIQKKTGVTITLPPELEGDSVSVQFRAKNTGDFLALGQRLEELSRLPEAQRIFSILAGDIEE